MLITINERSDITSNIITALGCYGKEHNDRKADIMKAIDNRWDDTLLSKVLDILKLGYLIKCEADNPGGIHEIDGCQFQIDNPILEEGIYRKKFTTVKLVEANSKCGTHYLELVNNDKDSVHTLNSVILAQEWMLMDGYEYIGNDSGIWDAILGRYVFDHCW